MQRRPLKAKYKTLRDLVYDYIGQQLRAGVIKPTSTIKETALSEELSISRTPVREALIQLTGAGLLESVPHKGFRIRTLSETLERLKSRLFRHHYQTMSKDEREKFLLGLNGEHTHICELFAVRDADALERYLIDVHWNPAEALYEVLG